MSFFDRFFGRKGLPPSPQAANRVLREQVYSEVYGGPPESVLHELDLRRQPHTDVYRFPPRGGRTHHTYLTGGMSELPQPGLEGQECARVELMFYAGAHDPLYAEMLRNFAHYPFETGAVFRGWDLVPLWGHAEAVLGSPQFTHLLFCVSTRQEDSQLPAKLQLAGEQVYPLTVLPLTLPESKFLADQGVAALLEKISQSPISIVFYPQRASFV